MNFNALFALLNFFCLKMVRILWFQHLKEQVCPCHPFGQVLWFSSGRRWSYIVRNTCHYLALHPLVGATGLWLDTLLVSFNAAIQHLGSSRPPSLLRDGWFSWMWMASFTSSSLAAYTGQSRGLPTTWLDGCMYWSGELTVTRSRGAHYEAAEWTTQYIKLQHATSMR